MYKTLTYLFDLLCNREPLYVHQCLEEVALLLKPLCFISKLSHDIVFEALI